MFNAQCSMLKNAASIGSSTEDFLFFETFFAAFYFGTLLYFSPMLTAYAV